MDRKIDKNIDSADIGLSPFKLRLDLDDKCFPLGCIYVIFDDIPKV